MDLKRTQKMFDFYNSHDNHIRIIPGSRLIVVHLTDQPEVTPTCFLLLFFVNIINLP